MSNAQWFERLLNTGDDLSQLQQRQNNPFLGQWTHAVHSRRGELMYFNCESRSCAICEAYQFERSEYEAFDHAFEVFQLVYPPIDPKIRQERLIQWEQDLHAKKQCALLSVSGSSTAKNDPT